MISLRTQRKISGARKALLDAAFDPKVCPPQSLSSYEKLRCHVEEFLKHGFQTFCGVHSSHPSSKIDSVILCDATHTVFADVWHTSSRVSIPLLDLSLPWILAKRVNGIFIHSHSQDGQRLVTTNVDPKGVPYPPHITTQVALGPIPVSQLIAYHVNQIEVLKTTGTVFVAMKTDAAYLQDQRQLFEECRSFALGLL